MKYLLVLVVGVALSKCDAAAVDGDKKSGSAAITEWQQLINEDCHQPRETGRCFALFHRFAFNVENHQCEEFIYGGCSGNKNNFESKEDCERECLRWNSENSTTVSPHPTDASIDDSQTVSIARTGQPLFAIGGCNGNDRLCPAEGKKLASDSTQQLLIGGDWRCKFHWWLQWCARDFVECYVVNTDEW